MGINVKQKKWEASYLQWIKQVTIKHIETGFLTIREEVTNMERQETTIESMTWCWNGTGNCELMVFNMYRYIEGHTHTCGKIQRDDV